MCNFLAFSRFWLTSLKENYYNAMTKSIWRHIKGENENRRGIKREPLKKEIGEGRHKEFFHGIIDFDDVIVLFENKYHYLCSDRTRAYTYLEKLIEAEEDGVRIEIDTDILIVLTQSQGNKNNHVHT